MIARPPGRRTRWTSVNPAAASGQWCTEKELVTRSTELSGSGRAATSPTHTSTRSSMPSRAMRAAARDAMSRVDVDRGDPALGECLGEGHREAARAGADVHDVQAGLPDERGGRGRSRSRGTARSGAGRRWPRRPGHPAPSTSPSPVSGARAGWFVSRRTTPQRSSCSRPRHRCRSGHTPEDPPPRPHPPSMLHPGHRGPRGRTAGVPHSPRGSRGGHVEGGIASRAGARAEDRYGLVIVLVILSYGIAAAYGTVTSAGWS